MNGLSGTITEYIISFLKLTSWRMYKPHVFGFVHVYAFIIVVIVALLAAVRLRNASESRKLHILTTLGWIMVIMEIYKQLFYYYIVNDGAFDWWFFPFQLCSIPMYMCILLPFVKQNVKSNMLTFMTGFTFVSALAALMYPEDMLRPYISLTAHGFIWHGMLFFISLLIGISGMADLTVKGYFKSVGLFLALAVIAILINIIAEPMARSSLVTGSYPNMFYLSPFHMSNQPFVESVELAYGRPVAMAAYTAAIIVLAGVSDFLFWCIGKLQHR